jgi:SAM-dependent methyltransferase
MSKEMSAMKIEYRPSEEGWLQHTEYLKRLVLENRCRRICEIGGGANPALPIEFVREHSLDYLIVDISPSELAKAPQGYRTRVLDITKPVPGESENCDLIFSKMLAEHIGDAPRFYENVRKMLRPGGLAFHFFPTLYAPPFVLNRLIPERVAYWLLNILQPGREASGKNAKFPAYYHWCRGPYGKQIRRLESAGFRIQSYTGFYGHWPYYQKVPFLVTLHKAFCDWLIRHPIPALTSFAYVVLERRDA